MAEGRWWPWGAARLGRALAVVLVVAGVARAARPLVLPPLTARPVPLDPSDPGREVAGVLPWRGGLVLTSGHGDFGGLSALHVQPDGGLLAVSDRGAWFRFGPVVEGGRLVGATELERGRLQDGRGRLRGRRADAEAMAAHEGRLVVAFEHHHRLLSCAAIDVPCEALAGPPLDDLPANGGIEALASLGDELIALAEEGGGDGWRPAWRGRPGAWRSIRYATADGFVPTGAAALPDGSLVVLERRFRLLDGVRSRVVHVADPDAELLQGRELARLAPPLTVDNLESVAVATVDGERWLYLVSDDNFRPDQRTLLLAFALPGTVGSGQPRE